MTRTADVEAFVRVTGVTKGVAADYINRYGHFDRGLDEYYEDQRYSNRNVAKKAKVLDKALVTKLETFFNTYANTDSIIDADGIMRMCGDLAIEASDIVWLVVAWNCSAENVGEFTREEFTKGFNKIEIHEFEKFKCDLNKIRNLMKINFTEIYSFTFSYYLMDGSRNLPLDVATAIWGLLLPYMDWSLSEKWIQFISSDEVTGKAKPITKDIWNMLLEFATRVPDSVKILEFENNGSWPLLIDDFYDHISTHVMKD
jgi:hypothetical protein